MTRIYGITFPKKKMLDEYLVMLEEAKKRDHRKIGKEMDLFMFTDMVGKGLPMWLPKGTALRIRLQDFLVEALPMASSVLRARLAAGEECENELPASVRRVIRREGLYTKGDEVTNESETGKRACAQPTE